MKFCDDIMATQYLERIFHDMIKTIHKARIKDTILFCIVCLVLGGVLLYFSLYNAIAYVKGPTELEEISISSELEKQYISYPVTFLLDDYMETYSKSKYQVTGSKKSASYLAIDPNTGDTFGIEVEVSSIPKMEELVDASWAYLDEETDTFPDEFVVQGSIQKLKEDELRYFKDALDYYDLDYPEEFYVLTVGYINGETPSAAIFVTILGSAFVFLSIGLMSSRLRIKEKKIIDKFLGEHPELSFSVLESEFAVAENMKDKIWIGRNYTFTLNKTYPVLEHENLKQIKFMSDKVSKKYTVTYLSYITKAEEEIKIQMTESNAESALKVYKRYIPSLFE